MANVYLSFMNSGSRNPIAVKVVKRELADDPEFRRRFRLEVAMARRVQGQAGAGVAAPLRGVSPPAAQATAADASRPEPRLAPS